MNPEKNSSQKDTSVFVFKIDSYDKLLISQLIPKHLFEVINHGNTVIIKPNWIRESHLTKNEDWNYVITHPSIISAVIEIVVEKLGGKGKIIITDGPETASNFTKILAHYPISEWTTLCEINNIDLEIIDLRDDEWIIESDVVVERKKLTGDPRGSTQVNLLEDASEFFTHTPPEKGYFGADSNIAETNYAHNGINNLYRVSRTVIESDVFINIPKLKTHKKSGITCSLKNLVGINTYKNYLPHNSIGTSTVGGDQFPNQKSKSKIESKLMPFIHQYILINPRLSKWFVPFLNLGKKVFGDNSKTIRGGSWYGNDTLWRTILDLNKILFYANSDGSLREDAWHSTKKYITIVDAITAGEGNGPKSPDPVNFNYIFCGCNPVAVDAVCAGFMGFDPLKIPQITKAFNINRFPLTTFKLEEIIILIDGENYKLNEIPPKYIKSFLPHFGWIGHIEKV